MDILNVIILCISFIVVIQYIVNLIQHRHFLEYFRHKKCGYTVYPWDSFELKGKTNFTPEYCRKCGELKPTFTKILKRRKFPLFREEVIEVSKFEDRV